MRMVSMSPPVRGWFAAMLLGLLLASTGLAQPSAATPVSTGATAGLEQPILVRGRVLMENGEPLPERVMIERSCQVTTSAHLEGYTDSDGYFTLQLGLNRGYVPDAATGRFDNGKGQDAIGDGDSGLWKGPAERDLYLCELRAHLTGYFSTSVQLANRRLFNDPDIGTIFLRTGEAVEGLTISATAELAPKEARKEFADGMKDLLENKTASAEEHFLKAVAGYDRHAEAWYRLGNIYRDSDRVEEATRAYDKSRESDPRYIFSYRGLLEMAFDRDDFPALEQYSQRMIELNPYEYPIAYYYNAVANLGLRNLSVAEERARRAIEMDRNEINPKSHYVMGWVKTRQSQFDEARKSFHRFLDLTTEDGETEASAREALLAINAGMQPQAAGPISIQPSEESNAPLFQPDPQEEAPKRPSLK